MSWVREEVERWEEREGERGRERKESVWLKWRVSGLLWKRKERNEKERETTKIKGRKDI